MVYFLGLCFLIGLSASAALGPIFMLTLSRSMTYGFWHGFATACGSALVDGLFFSLGLVGLLPLVAANKPAIMAMDFFGGAVLIFIAVRTYYHQISLSSEEVAYERVYISMIKSFLITCLNPGVAFFFMIVCVNFFYDFEPTVSQIIFGGLLVSLGSLSTLSLVAFFSRWLGIALNPNKLKMISYVNTLLFFLTGAYFLFDFFKKLIFYLA